MAKLKTDDRTNTARTIEEYDSSLALITEGDLPAGLSIETVDLVQTLDDLEIDFMDYVVSLRDKETEPEDPVDPQHYDVTYPKIGTGKVTKQVINEVKALDRSVLSAIRSQLRRRYLMLRYAEEDCRGCRFETWRMCPGAAPGDQREYGVKYSNCEHREAA